MAPTPPRDRASPLPRHDTLRDDEAETITGAPRQAAPDPDHLIGQTLLGQFKITGKLGEGAYGAVYLAEQLGVARKAAIKILRTDLVDAEVFVKRFQREAKVLGALDHPHLIRLYTAGRLETGELFLAMEYGGELTLEALLRKEGRLPPARALWIAEQICGALEEAHRHGVIHRDVKPGNVMLGQRDGKDWSKLVDVGIAKLLDHSDVEGAGGSVLTAAGLVIGTPAYFSPEQARDQPLDGRSDLYSLGLVLFEALTGKSAIVGKTAAELLRAHTRDAPKTLRAAGLETARSLEKLVARSLAKDPADRFTDAAQFAAALAAERQRWESGVAAKEATRAPDGARSALAKALPFIAGALVLAAAAFVLLR